MNTYQLYRGTAVGMALQDTLDEFMQQGYIRRSDAQTILLEFDRVINKALSTRTNTRLEFKAERLCFYRNVDNVWTLVLANVEFRDLNKRDHPETVWVDKLKIVACDGNANKDLIWSFD